jgi:hypothetical protein
MNTILLGGSLVFWFDKNNCPNISVDVKFFKNFCFPVKQNLQFKEHPHCDETQRVFLFISGMYTVS